MVNHHLFTIIWEIVLIFWSKHRTSKSKLLVYAVKCLSVSHLMGPISRIRKVSKVANTQEVKDH